MPEKVEPKSDYVQIAYNGIREMFLFNEVIPGQNLNYRHLADKLNMSITPLVQALKILEQEQLVKHIPNRGYFCEPLNPREIKDLYALRKLIEVALIPDVIDNLSEERKELFQSKYEKHKSVFQTRNFTKRLRTDIDLHLTLAKSAERNIHYQTLHRIFDLLYLKYRAHFFTFSTYKNTPDEHFNILDSIFRKDVKKAKSAMKKHISRVEKNVLNNYSASITVDKNNWMP